MIYVDNLRMLYGCSVELHKMRTQENKFNIDTKKLVVVECLDKYEVTCCDDDIVTFLDDSVVKLLLRIIRMVLMLIFSSHTPYNRLLSKPWVGNV